MNKISFTGQVFKDNDTAGFHYLGLPGHGIHFVFFFSSLRKIVIKIGKKKKRKPESSEEESDDDPPPRHTSKDDDSVRASMHTLLQMNTDI